MAADNERSPMIDQLELAIEKMFRGERATVADPQVAAMMGIASDLRDLPRESFLAHLGQRLGEEGELMLATENQVREGYKTVTPYIVVKQIEALADFLKNALGAEETYRSDQTGSGGGYHYEFRLGHSMLMAGGAPNYPGQEITPYLHYFVADVDEAYRRALAAGATSLYAPTDHYGTRDCGVKDSTGVEWYLSNPTTYNQGREKLIPGDLVSYLHPKGADQYIDFLKRAFGAEEIEVHREQGQVAHAKLRIQDSILELGEARGHYQPNPTMIFLYVADADAWFQRAVKAGAEVSTPMADLPYGRTGAVKDAQGNLWHVCTPPSPK